MIKLCTDAAVQSEIADEVLGRVFALYDIVFNVGYVIAVAAAALLSPPDGRATAAAGAALLDLVGLVAHNLELRRAAAATTAPRRRPADQHAHSPPPRPSGAAPPWPARRGQRPCSMRSASRCCRPPDQRPRRSRSRTMASPSRSGADGLEPSLACSAAIRSSSES